ncbi:MAG: nucleoside-diphosphate kinase [Nitrososphaeria archaeon]
MVAENNNETLFFIKPDGIIRRAVGANVLKEIMDSDLEISDAHLMSIPREFFINSHYSIHRGKFFFDWLIDYVTLSPILIAILKGRDVTFRIREKLGDTIPTKASPDSIRGRYGIFGGVNVAHSSDSVASANVEVDNWSRNFLSNPQYNVDVYSYIDTYCKYPIKDSMLYRNISVKLQNKEITEEEANFRFLDLITAETDFSKVYIERFAKLLVRNVLLDRR